MRIQQKLDPDTIHLEPKKWMEIKSYFFIIRIRYPLHLMQKQVKQPPEVFPDLNPTKDQDPTRTISRQQQEKESDLSEFS